VEFIEKLAALVPPPRFNLVRYYVAQIIPGKAAQDSDVWNCGNVPKKRSVHAKKANMGLYERRYAWAELLKRVYLVDSLKCEQCGGKMRILCAIHPTDAIEKILDCLGIPSKPPPISPAVLGSDMDEYIN
jgi:hypothetical protein